MIASRYALGRSVKMPSGRANCHSVPTTGPIRDVRQEASKKASVSITKEQGRTTEFTEQARDMALRAGLSAVARSAPITFSVDSIVLPCSFVTKTLNFLITFLFFIIRSCTVITFIYIENPARFGLLFDIVCISIPTTRAAPSSPRYGTMPRSPHDAAQPAQPRMARSLLGVAIDAHATVSRAKTPRAIG